MAKKVAKLLAVAPKKKRVSKTSAVKSNTITMPPPMDGPDARVLDRLWATVLSRKDADPSDSHSARLLSRGTAKIAQKFGEEAVECLIEAVGGQRSALISESADVLYHLLVLWVDAGLRPEQVWAELSRREGMSGIAEKAARKPVACRVQDHQNSMRSSPWRMMTTIFSPVSCAAKFPARNSTRTNSPSPSPISGRRRRAMCWSSPRANMSRIADFGATASAEEITGFFRAVALVAKQLGVEETGYRLIANAGPDSHQEVPHFHVHILGGRKLGPLLAAPVTAKARAVEVLRAFFVLGLNFIRRPGRASGLFPA